MDAPQIITALSGLLVSLATLVQVLRTKATVKQTIGSPNGNGTALEMLAKASEKVDTLETLSSYTHKSVHDLRNVLSPTVAKVDTLWRDAGHGTEKRAAGGGGAAREHRRATDA